MLSVYISNMQIKYYAMSNGFFRLACLIIISLIRYNSMRTVLTNTKNYYEKLLLYITGHRYFLLHVLAFLPPMMQLTWDSSS